MTPEQYQQIREVFHDVIDLELPQRRDRYRELGLSPDIISEVEATIRATGSDEHDQDTRLEGAVKHLVEREQPAGSALLDRIQATEAASRYEGRGRIGRGGMGEVIEAWDRNLRRTLAIKRLTPADPDGVTPPSSRPAIERFLEEAQITAQLDHPGIVPVYEVGVDGDGHPYFTMKKVEGRTFEEILQLHQSGDAEWKMARCVDILRSVCQAMAFAHDRGVIHRDLKPANIMVGSYGEVLTMDWGLARVRDEVELEHATVVQTDRRQGEMDGSPILTRDGTVVGTPFYMSPEQARGERVEIGPKSDVYAVGAMLYTLLAGHPPYGGPGDSRKTSVIIERVRSQDPESLHRIAPTRAVELVAICEKAMARQPSDRYESMRYLETDLRHYLEGRVVQAYRTGAMVELTKWIRRNRLVAALLMAVMAAVMAGAGREVYTASEKIAAEKASRLALEDKNRRIEEALQVSQRERDVSEAISGYMTSLFASWDPMETHGIPLTATEHLQNGLREIAGTESGFADEIRARLLGTIGSSLLSLGETEAAALAVQHARALAEDPSDQLELAFLRAQVQTAAGEWGEAEAAYLLIKDQAHEAGGSTHRLVGESLHGLINLMTKAQRTEQANQYRREYIDFIQATSGDLLMVRAVEISILEESGRFAEAEALLRALYDEEVGRRGELDPLVLRLEGDIAQARYHQGYFEEATDLFRRNLDRAASVFGEDHPRTITRRQNLGSALLELGRMDEVAQLTAQNLELLRDRVNDHHPHVVSCLASLAAIAAQRGEVDEAITRYEEVLELARETYPSDSQYLLNYQSNLGELYAQRGRFTLAEEILTECYDRQRERYGPDHASVLETGMNLANVLIDLDRAEEGVAMYLETLDRCRATVGLSHVRTLTLIGNLSFYYIQNGQPELAEPLLEEALPFAVEGVGEEHVTTQGLRMMLHRIYQTSGRLVDSFHLACDEVRSAQDELGEDHPQALAAIQSSAVLLLAILRDPSLSTEAPDEDACVDILLQLEECVDLTEDDEELLDRRVELLEALREIIDG